MVFSDQTFLFFFLPVTLAIGIGLRRTNVFTAFLFFSSISFYFWSGGAQVLLLIFSGVLNYCGGLHVGRTRSSKWLWVYITMNLALLAFFKYAYFIASNIDLAASLTITQSLKTVILPIGISFFTFQAVSYLVDVHREEITVERDFFTFAGAMRESW